MYIQAWCKSNVRDMSLLCVTWLIWCDMTRLYAIWLVMSGMVQVRCTWHVTVVCDMTHPHATWLVYSGQLDVTHYISHGASRMYVTCHCCVWHDSYMRDNFIFDMGWLWWVGSLKWYVSFAEYRLFYTALLQKRPIILRSLLIVATVALCTWNVKRRFHMIKWSCKWCRFRIWSHWILFDAMRMRHDALMCDVTLSI